MTRKALRAIPEGTYRAVDFLDNDGIDLDKRIRIEVAVTVGDGAMSVDFAGSSPQVRGPFNVVPSGSLAAACYVVRAITDPTIPTNGGCFRPITLHLPEGSIVNPSEPGAGQLAHGHDQAYQRRHPRRASRRPCPSGCRQTAAASCWCWPSAARAPDGTRYVTGELVAGGSGASAGKDGVDVIETDATNCMNSRPRRSSSTRRSACIASPCAGIRAAPAPSAAGSEPCANTRSCTARCASHIAASVTSSRPRAAPADRTGQWPARSSIATDGAKEIVPSKIVTTLNAGDRVVFETAGGGGYGDPARRPPDQVRLDLADGKISPAGAEAYGQGRKNAS